jgi:hypothetical protein
MLAAALREVICRWPPAAALDTVRTAEVLYKNPGIGQTLCQDFPWAML